MPTQAIELTPDRIRLCRATTDQVLAALAASQLTDHEIMLTLSMMLRYYEDKTGTQITGMVGVPKGAVGA
jgi:hypothetical protein